MADVTPQHYEVKQSGGVVSPQEQLNKQLEEQKKIIIKGMDDDLRSGGKYEQIKGDLKYDVVGNIGVAIYKGKLDTFYKYSKKNGVEYYTNLPGLEETEDLLLLFGKSKSGYELKDGKLFKVGKEIPQFLLNGKINPEFVKGINDLSFYIEAQITFGLMRSVIEGDKIEFSIKGMYLSIVRGVMKIKDVMYFYSKGYIPEKDFERLLLRAIQELPNQCSDTRFNNLVLGKRDLKNITMEITKNELDEYLHPTKGPPLITQSMYDNCLKRIEARDRKINETNGVKEEGKTERDIGKTQIGVVGKVRSILGF